MRVGAVILAGGVGQRMGQPKERLPFGPTTLLQHVVAALRGGAGAGVERIVVVARDRQQRLPDLPEDTAIVCDELTGAGPLAGLVAGLLGLVEAAGFADDDVAFLCGCDMPFVDAGLVGRLVAALGDRDVLMPRAEGLLQPLCACYRLRILAAARDLLAAGERTPRALARLPGARVLEQAQFDALDPTGRALRNLNTPADHEAALAEFERLRAR